MFLGLLVEASNPQDHQSRHSLKDVHDQLHDHIPLANHEFGASQQESMTYVHYQLLHDPYTDV